MTIDLTELRRLLEAASHGKWIESCGTGFDGNGLGTWIHNDTGSMCTELSHDEGQLLCALANAAPALLAVVEAAKHHAEFEVGSMPALVKALKAFK